MRRRKATHDGLFYVVALMYTIMQYGRAIRCPNVFSDIGYLESHVSDLCLRKILHAEIYFHGIEIVLVSREDEDIVRLPIDAQRHAEHFIPALVSPRLCR